MQSALLSQPEQKFLLIYFPRRWNKIDDGTKSMSHRICQKHNLLYARISGLFINVSCLCGLRFILLPSNITSAAVPVFRRKMNYSPAQETPHPLHRDKVSKGDAKVLKIAKLRGG